MSYKRILNIFIKNLKSYKFLNSLFVLIFIFLYFLDSNKIIKLKKINYSDKKNFMQYTLR